MQTAATQTPAASLHGLYTRCSSFATPTLPSPSSPSSAAAIATSPSAAAALLLPGCACCSSSAPSRQMGSSSVPAPCMPHAAAAAAAALPSAAPPVACRRRCASWLGAAGCIRTGPFGCVPGCCCGGCAKPKSAGAGSAAACVGALDSASRLRLRSRRNHRGAGWGSALSSKLASARMLLQT